MTTEEFATGYGCAEYCCTIFTVTEGKIVKLTLL